MVNYLLLLAESQFCLEVLACFFLVLLYVVLLRVLSGLL